MSDAIKNLIGDELLGQGGQKLSTDTLNGKLVALYFSAHWCPPCRRFTPLLAQTYDTLTKAGRPFEVVFVSSDQDQNQFDEYFATMPWKSIPFQDRARKNALSDQYNVKGIPTLIVVDPQAQVVSSSARDEVARLNAKAFDTWATSANLPGFEASPDGGPAAEAVGNVECLNEKKKGSCKEIIKTGNTTVLESDSDEQLLLTLHFMAESKLQAIHFTAPTDGRAPAKINLFLNTPNMDFSNAEREKPTQVIELKSSDYVEEEGKEGYGQAKVPLQFVKFQKVNSLTFFIVSNVSGGEVTALNGIHCYGLKA
ncbi:putative nnucleoredoxin [Planoprotostelium fungivorum]|uniref:Putative nnucleoredoxin n=1 Tax=Planoprotostelium fungivorum TaxID=1890364 RepID=A0A2P6NDF3_9EUKA|nr:putative nnucleoredoxin [Planoprotostelium fungivorum]